jgi:hypothetical protein
MQQVVICSIWRWNGTVAAADDSEVGGGAFLVRHLHAKFDRVAAVHCGGIVGFVDSA